MISISTQLFDILGVAIFPDRTIFELNNPMSRRVNTVPTLDGGAYFSDQGFSETDDGVSFNVSGLGIDAVNNILRIAKLHSRVWLCMSDGAVEAAFRKADYISGRLSLSFIIIGSA